MSTERQMWDYMRPRLQPFGRVIRVENPAYLGTPDVYYLFKRFRFREGVEYPAFSGWLELKHIGGPPIGSMTPIWHDDLTLDQVTWLEDEAAGGGRAHLLLRCGRAYTLMNVKTVRKFYRRELTYVALQREALYHCEDFFSPGDLVRCLRGI